MSAARPDHATLQQAAQWYAQLSASPPDQAMRQAWRQWHEESDMHRQAWQYVERISQRFAPLQQDAETALQTLGSARRNARSRRQVLGTLALLSGGALLGWLGLGNAQLGRPLLALRADYRSPTGAPRRFDLADGTRIWLNSASALDVDYQADLRLLRLLDGEVLIETARDPRPLVVETAEGRLRALGTRFSVVQHANHTQLSVFDGAVEVRSADGGGARVARAGQQLAFDRQRIGDSSPANDLRQGWRDGMLLANDMPLADFVAELTRYRHGHLGVAPEIAGLRVMGTYPLHDTEQALAMLEGVLPVRVRYTLPWWATLEPR
ncbi:MULTISPECIES: FecR domain-containing protein [unclassified Pseudomonas]|uniref:FecR domain-containing protein n=1 Tax=unclassified Pseudomonas TaxID=196821 RepID=UPI00244D3D7B|nr:MULTISPECIES: FecR domain-containing protein [unclassified Pseudomonas]MDH0894078.1 FecR domain-containing protein [Pseudomonas sp. GD03875]MDH1062833.1 FecR domain-containing protein [Pseudomonas sp. GD03985]